MATTKLLITGSIAYDLLLNYDGSFTDGIDPSSLDSMSLAFVTPHFERHYGGTGSNIAYNLQLLGGDPILVSSVGDDGDEYLSLLSNKGIDVSYIDRVTGKMTATAILATDTSERHIIFFHPGADAAGKWPDLSSQKEDISYAIVSPRDASLMMKAIDWCCENEIPVIFDPGQQLLSFGDDELKRGIDNCNALIVNSYEWNSIADRLNTSEQDIINQLDFLVITMGEDGLRIITKEEEIKIPACKAGSVINPTGAGDALRSGLLFGLDSGWSFKDIGRLGAAMGSFAVEQRGTLLKNLDIDALKSRAKSAYGEELPKW